MTGAEISEVLGMPPGSHTLTMGSAW